MKILNILLLALFSTIACSDNGEEKMLLVNEYMQLSELNKTITLYSETYTSQAKRTYSYAPSTIWTSPEYGEIMLQYHADLWSSWAKVYYSHLSSDELKELIEFLTSPLGKKFLSLQLELEPIFTKASFSASSRVDNKLNELLKKY